MNTDNRHYIRHPSAIPIIVRKARSRREDVSMHDVSLGVLTFEFPRLLAVGIMISVGIPGLTDAELHGQIVWSARYNHGYIIGMAFTSKQDALRSRIVEQICQIEAYRREQVRRHGRHLDSEAAAAEWIRSNAEGFPLQDL